MKFWYYAVGGKVSGPVGTLQLIELIEQQSLTWSTLVWSQGLPGWITAGEACERYSWEAELASEA